MTVAAVILSATTEGALTDTLGQPRVRRLVDLAWSGGALPVMVSGGTWHLSTMPVASLASPVVMIAPSSGEELSGSSSLDVLFPH